MLYFIIFFSKKKKKKRKENNYQYYFIEDIYINYKMYEYSVITIIILIQPYYSLNL